MEEPNKSEKGQCDLLMIAAPGEQKKQVLVELFLLPLCQWTNEACETSNLPLSQAFMWRLSIQGKFGCLNDLRLGLK